MSSMAPYAGVSRTTTSPFSELLAVIQLGTIGTQVVYNKLLGPQELPPESRVRKLSNSYAKYRVRNATIRVQSAIPTSAGGQYAIFYDPNPTNDWTKSESWQTMMSMPTKAFSAAWEKLELVIPRARLGGIFSTEDLTTERLVTRFGQIMLMTVVPPNTTPPGVGQVTVWLDATFEFFEENVSHVPNMSAIQFPAGQWSMVGGIVSTPTFFGTPHANTVYRMFPGLPGTMVSSGEETEYVAIYALPNVLAFRSFEWARNYALYGVYQGFSEGPGVTPTQTLPQAAWVPLSLQSQAFAAPSSASALSSDAKSNALN